MIINLTVLRNRCFLNVMLGMGVSLQLHWLICFFGFAFCSLGRAVSTLICSLMSNVLITVKLQTLNQVSYCHSGFQTLRD